MLFIIKLIIMATICNHCYPTQTLNDE